MRRVVLLLLALSLSGCGLIQRGLHSLKRRSKKPDVAAPSQDTFIGVVESVNPEQKFVLVRMEMRMAITPGTRLETRPMSGMKSVLVVTPERKLSFVSADISEGFPSRGDYVVMPPQSPVPAPSATTTGNAPVPGVPPVPDLPLPQSPEPNALPLPVQ